MLSNELVVIDVRYPLRQLVLKMIRTTHRVLLLSYLIVLVNAMEKTQMYMKRSQVDDQSMSGSGYSYNVHDGSPQDFSFDTSGEDKSLDILRDLGYDAFADLPRYATEHIPLPYEQYYKEFADLADQKPIDFEVNHHSYNLPEAKFPFKLYSPLDQYEKITYPPKYPYAHGYDHHSHDLGNFLKKGGKSYGEDETSKYGEKVDTGYKTIDAFDKALKGTYGSDDSKSYYNQNGGAKRSEYDNAGKYAANNAAGGVSLGGSFGQATGHNKGSITTGYHKVYNKDDYNKQHKFYDKADKRGHFSKFGDFNANHGNEQGAFVKGGSADQGQHQKKYGVKGVSDQGKFEDVNKGFKNAEGNEGFYVNHADFSKDSGKEGESIQGYGL